MGKIVKYCQACEEGFAEKFSFCPNCASELTAFEMKPMADVAEPSKPASPKVEKQAAEEAEVPHEPAKTEEHNIPVTEQVVIPPSAQMSSEPKESIFEPLSLGSDGISEDEPEIAAPDEPAILAEESIPEPPVENEPIVKDAATEFETTPAYVKSVDVEEEEESEERSTYVPATAAAGAASGGSGDFGVTVISERNSGVKNGLLLAAFLLTIFTFGGAMVYSLFNNFSNVPPLVNDPNLIAYVNDTPLEVEEQELEEKDDDDSGGGGGGGKERPTPASEGVRPRMMKNPPPIPPSAERPPLTKPDLAIDTGIKGPIDEPKPKIRQRVGVPGGALGDPSDGTGSGGGVGSGRGTGVGSGRGGGAGSGSGGGLGSGSGGGIGDGGGRGRRARTAATPKPRPPKPSGPTRGLQITSKPRPGYTEAARKNNITGSVRLRVTFNANGRIGSITPVSRLGYGLTEKAIAAARAMRFKPAVRNGSPYTVRKTIVFNFKIY